MPSVRFGQVLVLTNENDRRNPEFFRLVLLETFADDLRFADIGLRCVGQRIAANKDIYAGLPEFLASEEIIQLGARCGDGLASRSRALLTVRKP